MSCLQSWSRWTLPVPSGVIGPPHPACRERAVLVAISSSLHSMGSYWGHSVEMVTEPEGDGLSAQFDFLDIALAANRSQVCMPTLAQAQKCDICADRCWSMLLSLPNCLAVLSQWHRSQAA